MSGTQNLKNHLILRDNFDVEKNSKDMNSFFEEFNVENIKPSKEFTTEIIKEMIKISVDEGRRKQINDIVLGMLEQDLDINIICKCTGLTPDDIEDIIIGRYVF